jgi:hypothetical protein
LLLDTRAKFYMRLSDEALYDIRDVEELVRELGRTRYRPSPVPPAGQAPVIPVARDLGPLSQDRAQRLMEAAVNGVDGVHSAHLYPGTTDEDPPWLAYGTALSSAGLPKPFMDQLRQVIHAAVAGFVRAEPPWEGLEFAAGSPDGYNVVTISRQAALEWYTGKLDDAAFEKTWDTEGLDK